MKLIIAGGRNYHLTEKDIRRLDLLLPEVTEVISGKCRGADLDGEKWANSRGIPVKPFEAKWDDLSHPDCRLKKRGDGTFYDAEAGPRRNRQMAAYADAVALFPGGDGTQRMFEAAVESGIKIYDFRPSFPILGNSREKELAEVRGMNRSLLTQLDASNALVRELTHIFELQREREKPWIERWRQETGKELTLPDYGELLNWLFDNLDQQTAKLYAPGSWNCPQCGFTAQLNILYAETGHISASKETPEPCPNDGTALERVTWKALAGEYEELIKTLLDKQQPN